MKIYNNVLHYIFCREIGDSKKYFLYKKIMISRKDNNLKYYE